MLIPVHLDPDLGGVFGITSAQNESIFKYCTKLSRFGVHLYNNYQVTTCHTLKQVKLNATNNLAPFFRSSDSVPRFASCVAP